MIKLANIYLITAEQCLIVLTTIDSSPCSRFLDCSANCDGTRFDDIMEYYNSTNPYVFSNLIKFVLLKLQPRYLRKEFLRKKNTNMEADKWEVTYE